ncbi:MAG TPA: DinB family protein [Thermoanaerobaculia bacterium]|nr:DinB family protein [Thermoanaerobaculia bacterium]
MTPAEESLAAIETELNEAVAQARQLVETTEGRLFTVRPDPMSWSAAECIAHLSLSTESFLPIVDKAIEDGRKRRLESTKQPKLDMLGRLLHWMMEPPVRKRYPTSRPFVPKSARAKAEALAEFTSLQTKLIERVRAARGLDLRRMKVKSPFNDKISYNLYSAFRIIAAHERRHLWQAAQAVAALRRTA